MKERLSVKDWDEKDRPREKLVMLGEENLTDAELLAILIGSGSAQLDSVSLMKSILGDCQGSLLKLGKMSHVELMERYKGIGFAKAVAIKAACELSRRRQSEQPERRAQITSSRDIYNYFYSRLCERDVEECHALYLNQANRILCSQLIGRGGQTSTSVDVRVVLQYALMCKATAFALAHNHPTGNIQPSRDDDHLTRNLAEAGRIMNIRLIDHLILGDMDGRYYSYADYGKI